MANERFPEPSVVRTWLLKPSAPGSVQMVVVEMLFGALNPTDDVPLAASSKNRSSPVAPVVVAYGFIEIAFWVLRPRRAVISELMPEIAGFVTVQLVSPGAHPGFNVSPGA